MKLYKVVDNEFNRKNYPDLIGQIPSSPPAYASVEVIETPMKFSGMDYNFVAKRIREQNWFLGENTKSALVYRPY